MTEDELGCIFRRIPKKRTSRTFRVGDTVRIRSGPFASFTGKIEGINQAKSLLKVTVTIFGRAKPIKLNYMDVENISGLSASPE